MNEKVGPPAFCSRSFANVPSAFQRARTSSSRRGWSGLSGRGWKIGFPIGKSSLGSGVLSIGRLGNQPRRTKGTDGNRRNRRHLYELEVPLFGDPLEHGIHRVARAAPLRPEVDEYGLVCLQ